MLAESHDELWVLGDLVNYGPNPSEVVDLASVACLDGSSREPRLCHRQRIGPALLERFPGDGTHHAGVHGTAPRTRIRGRSCAVFRPAAPAIDGYRFFLCHATPTEPLYRYCPADPAQWAPEIEGLQADIVLTGHTHLPFTMNLEKQRIVNPGSVGQPKHGAPMACYALWENGRLSLQSCRYPVEETVKKVFSLPVPMEIRSQLAAVLLARFLPGRGEQLAI